MRYADNYVVGFESGDARRFIKELAERFAHCGLGGGLHPDKTRLLEFGKNAQRDRWARGKGRPETSDFLGFTHCCRKDRKGRFALGRKPVGKRMRRTVKVMEEQLRRRTDKDTIETGRWLGRVLRGWFNYFAAPGNWRLYRDSECRCYTLRTGMITMVCRIKVSKSI